MSRLSVVIPAFNEQEAIGQVIERVLASHPALRAAAGVTEMEVLVVDDGSTDGTAQIVEQAAARARGRSAEVRLIRHPANLGYGAAVQRGFAEATGSLLAFLDADSTYPPEQLPRLVGALSARQAALVVGDRMSNHASRMPAMRRAGNLFFAHLVSLLSGTPVADCCSGMRALTANTWQRLGPLPNGLDFTPAMTVRALHQHLPLREIAIPYHERVGRSKLKVARDGVRFLVTILCETWAHRPARVGLVAIAGALCAVLSLAVVLLVLAALHWLPWEIGAAVGLAVVLGGLLRSGRVITLRRPARRLLSWPGVAGEQPERRGSRRDEHACSGGSGRVAARPR